MILLDYNGITISTLMSKLRYDGSDEVDVDLVRHLVLSNIIYYRKQFVKQYGEVVVCVDSHTNLWRRDVFPYYKAHRKKQRAKSDYDWNVIYSCMNQICDEAREHLPYRVLRVDGAEGDDIIAVLAKHEATVLKQPTMIVSSDQDFIQLQKYGTVKQYSPTKKMLLAESDPDKFLRYHIMSGDDCDGIPNFLSPDAVFVTEGLRQKSLYKTKTDIWVDQSPEMFCETPELLQNYERNRTLIDFDYIPEEIVKRIFEAYSEEPIGSRGMKLLTYLTKRKLRTLVDDIAYF